MDGIRVSERERREKECAFSMFLRMVCITFYGQMEENLMCCARGNTSPTNNNNTTALNKIEEEEEVCNQLHNKAKVEKHCSVVNYICEVIAP